MLKKNSLARNFYILYFYSDSNKKLLDLYKKFKLLFLELYFFFCGFAPELELSLF